MPSRKAHNRLKRDTKKMKTKKIVEIGVLVSNIDGCWMAQGVEYDLFVQAKNVKDLEYELELAIVAHCFTSEEMGIEPLSHLPAPPAEVKEAFKTGRLFELKMEQFVLESKKEFKAPKVNSRYVDSFIQGVPCIA